MFIRINDHCAKYETIIEELNKDNYELKIKYIFYIFIKFQI